MGALLGLCLGLGAWVPPAAAIPVTITYSIGGGSFAGPYSTGPIQGGTLALLFPNAVSLYQGGSGTYPLLAAFTLTGTSGYFRQLEGFDGRMDGTLNPWLERAAYSTLSPGLPMRVATGSPAWTGSMLFWFTVQVTHLPFSPPLYTDGGHIYGSWWRWGTPQMEGVARTFTLGQEISRTPEPGTFAELAVGMIGLAAVARWRRRRG